MKRILLETVGSTNDYMKQNAPWEHGDRVIARRQTAGRGRRGRSWSAEGGIAFTVYLESETALSLPAVAAVAAGEVLEKETGLTVGIKWPNDLIVNQRKIGGILAETVGDGYLIGIGINLAGDRPFFDRLALPYATSVQAETGQIPDGIRLADAVCDALPARLSEGWQQEYRRRSVTLGNTVRVLTASGDYTARAIDLTPAGELIVERDGETAVVRSGEVSVRGLYGY